MLGKKYWNSIKHEEFEVLAFEHVKDLYPSHQWNMTSNKRDGGRDAEGKRMDTGFFEEYWMEAKHHPEKLIGKYQLDTHLVSVQLTMGNVKRLHIVTSGQLTTPFILRARTFANHHGFSFSYSDEQPLLLWMMLREEIVHSFFKEEAPEVLNFLSKVEILSNMKDLGILGKANFYSDDGWLTSHKYCQMNLTPGRKYFLHINITFTKMITSEVEKWVLKWKIPSDQVKLLAFRELQTTGIPLIEIYKNPFLFVPFRFMKYSPKPLPALSIIDSENNIIHSIELNKINQVKQCVPKLIGKHCNSILVQLKKIVKEEVLYGSPRLVGIIGKAGSGKTRLAEEIRDVSQNLGFEVKSVPFSKIESVNEKLWISLFRWLFGLQDNAFNIKESEIIESKIKDFFIGKTQDMSSWKKFERKLIQFLVGEKFIDELFDTDMIAGRYMGRVIEAIYVNLFDKLIPTSSPYIFHFEDSHYLSKRMLKPLSLLKHVVEFSNSIPLMILFTARNDETVMDRSIFWFTRSIRNSLRTKSLIFELHDLTTIEAKELIKSAINFTPEFEAEKSLTLSSLLSATGTNPFSLLQMINLLANERGIFEISSTGWSFIVDPAKLKKSIRTIPQGINNILKERFKGLIRNYGKEYLEILITASVWGKESPIKIIKNAAPFRVKPAMLRILLDLGYLSEINGGKIVLNHDLLIESLLKCKGKKKLSERLAKCAVRYSNKEIVKEKLALIYFHAGKRYYKRSWAQCIYLITKAYEKEDFKFTLDYFATIEKIKEEQPNTFKSSPRLEFKNGISLQHSGNTHESLKVFNNIRSFLKGKMVSSEEDALLYITSTIEAGNQYYLKAEASVAMKCCNEAIELLKCPPVKIANQKVGQKLALAYNRQGAVYRLCGNYKEAIFSLGMALEYAKNVKDYYLYSHTLYDLASVYRIYSNGDSDSYLHEARKIWEHFLKNKERRRIQLDIAENYSNGLKDNRLSNRHKIYSMHLEASEKGLIFQAIDALLCYSVCCLLVKDFDESYNALLNTLDLAVKYEDTTAKLHAYHYLSICVGYRGDKEISLALNQKASEIIEKDFQMRHSVIYLHLLHNNAILTNLSPPYLPDDNIIRFKTGELLWSPYSRV
jgi:tetratricopeptide (TPR) repeat protein